MTTPEPTTNEMWEEETQRMIDYVANETVRITTEFVKNKLFTYDEMREELDRVGERAIKKQATIISDERQRAYGEGYENGQKDLKKTFPIISSEERKRAQVEVLQKLYDKCGTGEPDSVCFKEVALSLGLTIKE